MTASGPRKDPPDAAEVDREFAYVLGHDLPGPLRAIEGNLRILARRHGDRLDEDGRACVEAAQRGARRMNQMVQDLRALVKLRTDPLNVGPIRLGDVVQAATPPTLTVRGAEQLPNLRGDAKQVHRLLAEVLENASIAARMTDGAPARDAVVTITWSDAEGCVTFADRSGGLSDSQAERACRPFHSTWGRAGLGLAVARQVAARHGGDLWLRADGPSTKVHWRLGACRLESGHE